MDQKQLTVLVPLLFRVCDLLLVLCAPWFFLRMKHFHYNHLLATSLERRILLITIDWLFSVEVSDNDCPGCWMVLRFEVSVSLVIVLKSGKSPLGCGSCHGGNITHNLQ